MKSNKLTALFLAVLMTASVFASCGDSGASETEDTADTTPAETVETEEIDPFADMDFGGEDIRMMVSSREKDSMISSKVTIMHGEELTGEVVSDAVYNRNILV